MGRHDEVEPLLLEAAELRRRVLGEEHPETVRVRRALGLFYEDRGRPDKAAEWREGSAEDG